MSQPHEIQYQLSDGREVCVQYTYTRGGFSDEEDSAQIDAILDDEGGEVRVDADEERWIMDAIWENEANTQPDADWRNEW